ncbi:hypothetical protein HZS_5546, partial [Henneguya salminicola]
MAEEELVFQTQENLEHLQNIILELKGKDEPRFYTYIESLQNIIDKIDPLTEKNIITDKSGAEGLNVFLEDSTILVIRSIVMIYKAISTDTPLNREHDEAIEIIRDFLDNSEINICEQLNESKCTATDTDLYESAKKLKPTAKASNFDISDVRKMRDISVLECIQERKYQLEQLLPQCTNSNLKTKGIIELRALNLVNFQRAMRERILNSMRKEKSNDLVPSLRVFKRNRNVLEKEKYFDRINNYQKVEDDRRHKRFQKDLLNSIIHHCKEFKEFHRSTFVRIIRVTKTIAIYHANQDKEKKKEEERIDKERMRRLMMEDEEGYRKLLDEKKDRRIHLLLNQTDEFIKSLMDLVSKHKELRILEDLTIEQDEDESTIKTKLINENEENKFETEIDQYGNDDEDLLLKSSSIGIEQNTDYRSYYKIAHAIGEEIKEQPSILECGQLKEYQLKGLEWMVSLYNNKLNGILADEMGLGKTIQTIALFAYLMENKRVHGPHIVVVPLSTMSNWSIELQKWCPKLDVVSYKGAQNTRKLLSSKIKSGKFNVLLTTYEYVMKDKYLLSKVSWKYMIVDEGHRMKNQDCKLTNILNYYYKAPYRLLLTGTPLQNRLPELWALLNFLLPHIFNSCTTFEQWFNAPFATFGERIDLNEEEKYLIIRRLHKILRPFLLRRLKKEVESQLPDKVEYVIKCHMSTLQRMIYHVMQKKSSLLTNIHDTSKNKPPRMLMNTIMQLRKVCNHPFLFPHIEESLIKHFNHEPDPLHSPLIYRVSGKFELLHRILPKLKALNHRCLIFCQMTQLMTILEDYLNYAQYSYLRLDGTTKSEDRATLLELFNAENSPYFIFILSTRAGGLGLNLQSADTVVIFDSDWNPQQDLQAQDRAHRIGQKNEVRVLRLMSVNSVEEKILAAARYKLNLDEKVIQAGMFNQSSTSKERKEFLEALLDGGNPTEEEENEVPDDDTLNQMISRSEEEYEFYQKMDENFPKVNQLIREDELPSWIKESFEETSSMNFNETLIQENNSTLNKSSPYKTINIDETSSQFETTQNTILNQSIINDSVSSEFYPLKRKKRGRPASYERRALDTLLKYIQTALDYIKLFETEDHRKISYVFYRLPTRKQLPHYYTIISKPIDIYSMEKKIISSKYKTWQEFLEDFELMITNALTYNPEGSQ